MKAHVSLYPLPSQAGPVARYLLFSYLGSCARTLTQSRALIRRLNAPNVVLNISPYFPPNDYHERHCYYYGYRLDDHENIIGFDGEFQYGTLQMFGTVSQSSCKSGAILLAGFMVVWFLRFCREHLRKDHLSQLSTAFIFLNTKSSGFTALEGSIWGKMT